LCDPAARISSPAVAGYKNLATPFFTEICKVDAPPMAAIIHPLLALLASLTCQDLAKQVTYFKAENQILRSKHAAGIPLEIVDSDRLQALAGSLEHQGLAVRLGPFSYQSLASLSTRLQLSPPSDNVRLVVICDRLQDGFNFGAILRY
jgi:tRNA G18 (ribose-2'-O)-methylase SpoU